jgi:serine/threonine-protein kinase
MALHEEWSNGGREVRAAGPAPLAPGTVERRGTDHAEMVYVPAGTFWMGSGEDDQDAKGDERPRHQITLPAFWLDKTPVTNAQFARFIQATGYTAEGDWQNYDADKDTHPVVAVTWADAQAYCRWAQKRLPTEAEWEYAARGTDGRKYPWGNTWDKSRANSNESGHKNATPVGAYPTGASPFGLLDMAGNVREWTSTLYKPFPYVATDGREDPNASGPRVIRGGSWSNYPGFLRSAYRYWGAPTNRNNIVGFRCAQDADR